ncbi:G-protein-signaling modulator 1-like isoform X2 [Oscarella lobularis]
MLRSNDAELTSVVWCLLGNSHFQLGHYEAASRCHLHDMAVCREAGDAIGETKACCNFGIAVQMQGQLKMAGRSFLKYMDGCVRDGDRTGIAKAYNNLALLWRMQGKEVIARASDAGTADTVEVLAEARRNFERANEYLIKYLDLMREFKNRRNEGKAFGNMGICYELMGDYDQALECYQQRLEIAKELEDVAAESRAHCNIGNCYQLKGNHDKAVECYLVDFALCEKSGDKKGMAVTARNLAITYEATGNSGQCLAWHVRNLDLCRDLKDIDAQLLALMALAGFHKDQGNREEAVMYYRQQLDILEATGDTEMLSRVQESIRRFRDDESSKASAEESPSSTKKRRGFKGTLRRIRKGTFRLLFRRGDRRSSVTKAEIVDKAVTTPGASRRRRLSETIFTPPPTPEMEWDSSDQADGLLQQVIQAVDSSSHDFLAGIKPDTSSFQGVLRRPSPSKKRRSKHAHRIYSQVFGGEGHTREIERQVDSMKGDKNDGFSSLEVAAEWDSWMAVSARLARPDSLQIDENLFDY